MREWRESEWRNAWTNSSRGCERLKEGGGEERRAEEKNSERINVLCLVLLSGLGLLLAKVGLLVASRSKCL